MPARRYTTLIAPGLVQPLENIPFHGAAPLLRRLLAGGSVHPDADLHGAVHEIHALRPAIRDFCAPDTHTCAELDLLLSFDHLIVRLTFADEVYIQEAPATVFIPAGVRHSANVIAGRGFFVAILPQRGYSTTFADATIAG